VAKHAKPTLTTTLSRNGARGAAALTMASFGFLATAPVAFAGGGDGDHHKKHSDATQHENNGIDSHQSEGIINVSDNDVLVPIEVCNNYVPINVLGVQVPIEDVAIDIPILSEGDSSADSGDETCQQVGAIGDAAEAPKPGAANPALVPGSNDVAVTPGGGDQAAGGGGAEGLGDVQGLVGDTGANSPADALAPVGAERSAGEAMGLVPQDLVGEQATTPAPAPMGDLGMVGTPDATQAEGLAPSGL
jgi:hypothetical protein